MKITEISKPTNNKTVVCSFARMNPPHVGHEKLINSIISESQALSCPYHIMVSQTVDKKKNPLPYDIKMKFIKNLFPSVSFLENVTYNKDGNSTPVKTPFDMVAYLSQCGFRNIVMVVGDDRIENFENMISPYVGKDFDIDSFKVISAGARAGNDLVEKSSGSLVRQLVNMDMKDDFDTLIPSNDQKIKDELYDALKSYL